MIADWILVGDDFGFISDNVAAYVAYGIGLGAIAWMLGQGIAILFKFLRY